MKEGFFLDRVNACGNDLTVVKAIKSPALVLPNSAYTAYSVRDSAPVATQLTPYAPCVFLMPEIRFMHNKTPLLSR
jgi:hypothetical protein